MRHCDPDRHAHRHADDTGRQHQRQAFRRFLPVSLVEDEQEPEDHDQAGSDAALQRPCQRHEHRDHRQFGRRLQHPEDGVDHRFEDVAEPVEHRAAVQVQPVERYLGRAAYRYLGLGQPLHRRPVPLVLSRLRRAV